MRVRDGGRRSCITRLFVMVSLSFASPPHLISSTPAAQMIVVAAVTRACAVCLSVVIAHVVACASRRDADGGTRRVDVTGNQ